MEKNYDCIIIGSGIAGLFFAQKVADLLPDRKVAVITKKSETASNTNYAQGGIATVTSRTDSFESHVSDTLVCGAGLCHEDVVREIVHSGPVVIQKLVGIGVKFTQKKGVYDLGREGGHSVNRVVHAADLTGREIERALLTACREKVNLDIYKDTIALDLITYLHNGHRQCGGCYTFTARNREFNSFYAPVTLLATGGVGQVYFNTTNPKIATGDGVAMAYRAGARVGNLEFVQFHPTTLYNPGRWPFLISEAVRGEGGILMTTDGKRFMQQYHKLKELAPRDIVARAIDTELKISGEDYVYLDVSHLDPKFIKKRFPNIYKECLRRGFDITTKPIPVVPAAHYECGGVVADVCGRTDIIGMYVCGESAFTGMHGANRLASNSLLEAVVMADYAADDAVKYIESNTFPASPPAEQWLASSIFQKKEKVVLSHDRRSLQRLMSDFLGIVRSTDRLKMAGQRVRMILNAINSYYYSQPVSYSIIELRNIATIADLIIRSATRRKESRGLHYVLDYPETDDVNWKRDSIIRPPNYIASGRHLRNKCRKY
ncbi:MAG: L-aspartate oxidase [candidate division Zixibacteria bacterium HGW-Zixibacteria-1]|nr:MAG: L-aspartate oxidase [candidate division Zixibacteria bacterium HGW-Zixibacteria-1]